MDLSPGTEIRPRMIRAGKMVRFMQKIILSSVMPIQNVQINIAKFSKNRKPAGKTIWEKLSV
jgi:hypothetical protein